MSTDVVPDRDEFWMNRALELAVKGQGRVEPNPMVGCVIVKDGRNIAEGYHHFFGGPHAEADALSALNSIDDAAGSTAYVTLEPCCHHGKTPPCSEALIDAKVERVVIAMQDPFAKVDGGGIGRLRDSGIRVDVGILCDDAEALNAPYLKRIRTSKPWTIAKWAMTADGRIATVARQSQWISGAESRRHVHRLRSRVDAILVGMGTVENDDPMLNARLNENDPQPADPLRVAKRVVLCHTRLPGIEAKLIQTAGDIPTWIYASPRVDPDRFRQIEASDAVVMRLETEDRFEMVEQALRHLGDRSMTNVMIEAGPEMMASFLGDADHPCQIDEFHVYVGAKLFGGASAPGPIAGRGYDRIRQTPNLELSSVDRFEDDVRLIYRRR